MHIVLDARIIETSTGRYMQRLLEETNDRYAGGEHRFTALVPSKVVEKWQERLPNIKVVAADQKWYTFSEQLSLYWQLRSLKPDLVHFLMPQQPLLYFGPAITTIHDTTLIHQDNISADDNPLVYRFKKFVFTELVRVVVWRAKAIITPTQFIADDLAVVYGKKYRGKMVVTYEAGDIPNVEPEPLEQFAGSQYICFVGNHFPYKNVGRVIDAFARLKPDYPELKLLIAGKIDEFTANLEQQVQSHNIPDVHFLGFVSDGEKRWLLQNSRAFVTASLAEGFCIPLLEAMIEGTPVIASNASCLPEVVGDGGILFNPDSTDDLVTCLKPILDDEEFRRSLVKQGKNRVNQFSWSKMVDETHAVYDTVLGK
jgi:glycosyltransferase involved in cell wall biosynthesis